MAKKRALISVYDKSGLEELAAGLSERDWDIIASGGTSKAIAAAGIPVQSVEDLTGAEEMLDGRVKTLHPIVHAGILARRESVEHMNELTESGISTLDLIAVNLYPFAATVASDPSRAELIENIDIGLSLIHI